MSMNKELYEISYSINGLSNSVLLPTDICPTALSLSERNAFLKQAVKCIINYNPQKDILKIKNINKLK